MARRGDGKVEDVLAFASDRGSIRAIYAIRGPGKLGRLAGWTGAPAGVDPARSPGSGS